MWWLSRHWKTDPQDLRKFGRFDFRMLAGLGLHRGPASPRLAAGITGTRPDEPETPLFKLHLGTTVQAMKSDRGATLVEDPQWLDCNASTGRHPREVLRLHKHRARVAFLWINHLATVDVLPHGLVGVLVDPAAVGLDAREDAVLEAAVGDRAVAGGDEQSGRAGGVHQEGGRPGRGLAGAPAP